MVNNRDIIDFLQNQEVNTGFINRLKIKYRPNICPFDDLLNLINEDDVVYDIGCGSGQFLSLVLQFTKSSRVFGIEIDDDLIKNAYSMLNKSRSKGKSIHLKSFNGLDFPDDVSEANLIFLIDVLHHVPMHLQINFLEGIYQRMKKGSKLVIKDIDGGSKLVYFNKLHDLIFSSEIGNELSCSFVTRSLDKLGFENITMSKRRMYVYPHFTVQAEKVH